MLAIIGIISLFFFMGGASVGAVIYHVVHGQFHKITHEDAIMTWSLLINVVLLPSLVFLWRNRETDEEAQMSMSSSSSLGSVHRVPFNKRIAFMVFSIVWIIGLVVVLTYGP